MESSLRDREQDKFRAASDNKSKVAVADETDRLISIVDEVNKSLIYFGYAEPGSSQSSAVWMIERLQISGSITTLQFADGNDLFDNIWANRAALTYA